jgi:hypothetical protein
MYDIVGMYILPRIVTLLAKQEDSVVGSPYYHVTDDSRCAG